VREDIETVVAEIRANPAAFADVPAVVRRSGFGTTRLFELFRQHYHSTPADLLLRARIQRAKQLLLTSDAALIEIASQAGFESLSVFHEHFRRLNGLTPSSYRELRAATQFNITLPDGYLPGYLRRALSRDTHSLTERLENTRYTTAVQFARGPGVIMLELGRPAIAARVTDGSAVEAHAIVVGLLGLDQDAADFARLARKLGFGRLVAGRAELRIAQIPSVFDGLLWSIIGQQINFAFACVLKRRLIERIGVKLYSGLYAPPTPAAVAALEARELAPLQFSRSKADYIIGAARRVAEGKLDLEALRAMSASRAERTLREIRGLGPWSVNYLMMRALGFPDCVPLGDTGVTSGLQAALQLEERPDLDATRRLMAVFSPYRSLATAHLWQYNQPVPT
jgi:AraC family transcriptional regulator of adaptative response / DNA-3-methyladenine glycosylase II